MSDNINVVACSNPFSTARTVLQMQEGLSIADLMREVQPDPVLSRYAHIYIDDKYVDISEWGTTFPSRKSIITIRVIPHGGGDGKKNPIATILSIVVLVVATVYGGPLGGAIGKGLGFSGTAAGWEALGTAIIGMVGSLAVSAIAPPPTQGSKALSSADDPTMSIAGARNSSGALKPIPKVLGKHLITPYYGALPYTELVGQDQYLRLLFVIGYGPLQILDHKIGEASLFDYSDVEIEVRNGYDDDPPLKLYPSTVVEESVGAALKQSTGWVQRTTAADIDEFNVEILFPSGLVEYTDEGDRASRTVQFELEYSITGQNNWVQARPSITSSAENHVAPRAPGRRSGREEEPVVFYRTVVIYVNKGTGRIGYTESVAPDAYPPAPAIADSGYTVATYHQAGTNRSILDLTDVRDPVLVASDAGNYLPTLNGSYEVTIAGGDFISGGIAAVTASSSAAVRYGTPVVVERGQYDVRVRRLTADTSDTQIMDLSSWSILRSIDATDPISLKGLAKVALRIKATDQLNGVIDQYNCVAQSIMLDWDGSNWVEQPTSNPAALYRNVFQGPGMKEPLADERFDLVELQAWSEECFDKGYEYNAVITQQSTPYEVAKDIAALGRASFAIKDGVFSVVRDSPEVISNGPMQWLTPRNSWDVKGSKAFDEVHGVQVAYIDALAGYRPEQVVVYAPGYDEVTATRVDEMQLLGITSHEQAYKQAWYYLAVARLRPEMHSRMVDVEHLVCTRGDLIRVTDDVAQHGLMSGRIASMTDSSGDIETITVDEVATMEAGKTYSMKIRYSDGSGEIYRAVTTVEGETDTFTLEVPIAAADAPLVGDLVMFGETDQETSDKLVHHIEMSDDLSARVFYVDAAPEVYTADSGTIPTYDPGITLSLDPRLAVPEMPVILDIRSDESAAEVQADGSFTNRIMISVAPGPGVATTESFECHYRLMSLDTPWGALPLVSAASGVVYIPDVIQGATYEIRLRALSSFRVGSKWKIQTHTVAGKTWVVPSVSDLIVENSTGDNITFVESDCHIVWTNAPDLWSDYRWLDYYLVEVLDKDSSAVLHTEQTKVARFDLSLEKNQALAGGPFREFKVRVTVWDIFGQSSSAVEIQPVNPQAGKVLNVTSVDDYGVSVVRWDTLQENALVGYEVHVSNLDGFFPTEDTLYAVAGKEANSIVIEGLDEGAHFIRVGGFDVFGKDSIEYSDQKTIVIQRVISATDMVDFPEKMSEVYVAPILEGDVWTNSAGTTLSWNSHSLWYDGNELEIAEGSTTEAYIYWNGPSATAYTTTDDVETFRAVNEDDGDFQIAINYGTSYELGWDSRANMVVGTAKIGVAAVQNAHIGNIIKSDNYDGLGAGWQIDKSGQIIGSALKILNPDGSTLLEAGQTLADPEATRNVVSFQTTAPTGASSGDIWIDTGNDNQQYTHDGTGWIEGKAGLDGQPAYLHIKYSANSDGNPMQDTVAEYIGILSDHTAADSTDYTDYTWSKLQGEDGTIGSDGSNAYLHIKYSNDGSTFTGNNGEDTGTWIGVYTDHTAADSTTFSDYSWSEIKGEQGIEGSSTFTYYQTATPSGAAENELWYSSATKLLQRYNGTGWDLVSVSGWSVLEDDDGTKPADNATAGDTLAQPFTQWELYSQSVVTITDGIVGTTALRLGLSGNPHQKNFIAIDTSKQYKVKLWARASSDCDGRLYFSMRQFKNDLTPCDTNSGRSPYYPSNMYKSTHDGNFGTDAWGEYSFIWDSAVWQPDLAYVQPEFLSNYGGTEGYWEIQGLVITEVSEYSGALATADTVNYGTQVTGTKPPVDADSTANAIAASVQVTSGGLRITDTNTTYNDYVELTPADIVFFYNNAPYKALRKMETGVASNGDSIAFPSAFKSTPSVLVSIRDLSLYQASYKDLDQAVEVYAANVFPTGFDVVAKNVSTGSVRYAEVTSDASFSSAPIVRHTTHTNCTKLWAYVQSYKNCNDSPDDTCLYVGFYALNIKIEYKVYGSSDSTYQTMFSGVAPSIGNTWYSADVSSGRYTLRFTNNDVGCDCSGTVFAWLRQIDATVGGNTTYATGDVNWIAVGD